MGTRCKTFLTSTTTVNIQQMSKILSRLVVKPKIIQSQSARKNHPICSIHQLICEIHLMLESQGHTHSIIIKLTLVFPTFVSAFLHVCIYIYIYIYIYIHIYIADYFRFVRSKRLCPFLTTITQQRTFNSK